MKEAGLLSDVGARGRIWWMEEKEGKKLRNRGREKIFPLSMTTRSAASRKGGRKKKNAFRKEREGGGGTTVRLSAVRTSSTFFYISAGERKKRLTSSGFPHTKKGPAKKSWKNERIGRTERGKKRWKHERETVVRIPSAEKGEEEEEE